LFDSRRGRWKLPALVHHESLRRTWTSGERNNNSYEASPTAALYEEIGEPGHDTLPTDTSMNHYELEATTSEPRSTASAPPPIYSIPHRPAPSSSSSAAAAAAAVNDPTYNNTTTTLIDNTLYGVQPQIPVTSSNVADNDITLIDNDLYER